MTRQSITSERRPIFRSPRSSAPSCPQHRSSGGGRGTHHAGGLHRLRHVTRVWLAPENMALEALVPGVHDEGERMDILPDAHEGQESHAALHQDLLFILQDTPFSSLLAVKPGHGPKRVHFLNHRIKPGVATQRHWYYKYIARLDLARACIFLERRVSKCVWGGHPCYVGVSLTFGPALNLPVVTCVLLSGYHTPSLCIHCG